MALHQTKEGENLYKLNNSSNTPLYLQIVEQTKLAIAGGILQDGDPMPSVRDLSKKLLVNTSTVSKAYKQLSELGIIKSYPGVGTFVSLDKSKKNQEIEVTKMKLREIFTQCRFLDISLDEIIEIYNESSKEIL
jgi:GntR family transcriptional regulator